MSKKKTIAIGICFHRYTKEDYLKALENTELGQRMVDLQARYPGAERGVYLVWDDEGHTWEVLIDDELRIQRLTGYD